MTTAAILDFWKHMTPTHFLILLMAGVVAEWALGRFAVKRWAWAGSTFALIAVGLRSILVVTRIGSIPVVGTGLVRVLESIAGIDLDGDGHVGDPPAPPVGPVIALLLALSTGVMGCAAVVSSLPAIVAAVTDGMLVLSNIESFCNAWFVFHPNPEDQKKVSEAISKARTALDAALNIANGAGEINKADLDKAFTEFKLAYEDVVSLVGKYGVHPHRGEGMRAAPGGGLIVPTADEILGRVRR